MHSEEPMRELELAGHPSTDPLQARGVGRRASFPLSRAAFAASVVVHVVAGYALSRQDFGGSVAPSPQPLAEFFLFEMPRPPPAVPAPIQEPEPAPPEERESQPPATPPAPAPAPAPRAADPAAPPVVVPVEVEPAPPPTVRVPSSADLAEARERAAQEVVSENSTENEYLTFSIRDVAAPRPEAEPDVPSIFDGGAGGGPPRGPTVGQAGQARTKFGHRMSSLCNALTGGFSLMGWGSFCGGPPDGGPSGLLPEVRPDYLDLMPECVDTRDTAPALALEAPFPLVKCRLVKQVDPEAEP